MTVDSDHDGPCIILHNRVSKPRLQDKEWVEFETERSRITEEDYCIGIPYVVEVKELLKDAIVVGHNI